MEEKALKPHPFPVGTMLDMFTRRSYSNDLDYEGEFIVARVYKPLGKHGLGSVYGDVRIARSSEPDDPIEGRWYVREEMDGALCLRPCKSGRYATTFTYCRVRSQETQTLAGRSRRVTKMKKRFVEIANQWNVLSQKWTPARTDAGLDAQDGAIEALSLALQAALEAGDTKCGLQSQ